MIYDAVALKDPERGRHSNGFSALIVILPKCNFLVDNTNFFN